jgi:hypothetical protein
MTQETIAELTADDAALLELGVALGQNNAFALVAGRCSAAQAQGLKRLRDERLYRRCAETWNDFCPRYLRISRVEADRTIRQWEEFGPAYFELSQLTRISPETYRAIAPAVKDGALHFNGEQIALEPGNARRVAAAVTEMRRAIPRKDTSPEVNQIVQELKAGIRDMHFEERIVELDKCCAALIEEYEDIICQDLGMSRLAVASSLDRVQEELGRLTTENEARTVFLTE